MLSGSVAMSIYIPRATRDFDFVVNLQEKDISLLVEHFKKGHYCTKRGHWESCSYFNT
jgi:hypothetical protein